MAAIAVAWFLATTVTFDAAKMPAVKAQPQATPPVKAKLAPRPAALTAAQVAAAFAKGSQQHALAATANTAKAFTLTTAHLKQSQGHADLVDALVVNDSQGPYASLAVTSPGDHVSLSLNLAPGTLTLVDCHVSYYADGDPSMDLQYEFSYHAPGQSQYMGVNGYSQAGHLVLPVYVPKGPPSNVTQVRIRGTKSFFWWGCTVTPQK